MDYMERTTCRKDYMKKGPCEEARTEGLCEGREKPLHERRKMKEAKEGSQGTKLRNKVKDWK